MDLAVGIFYLAVIFGGFLLVLCAMDWAFDYAYRVSPRFRKLINGYMDKLPKWED